MRKTFILLLILNVFSRNSFGQTFRSGFDNYEFNSGGQGQGYSFHSNVTGDLNWGEATYLESYINMFKATKDKKYLDKFIIHAKRVQERRDDNITLLPLGEVEGFPALFYDNNGNFVCQVNGVSQVDHNSHAWSTVQNIVDKNNNPDCQYNTQAVLHSATLTYPMAEFVYFMMTDPDFMAIANDQVPAEVQGFYPNINPYYDIQTYSQYAVWLRWKINETLQYHECYFQYHNFANLNVGIYYNQCSDCPDCTPLAPNMQAAMGRTLIMMYLVESMSGGNTSYAGIYLSHVNNIATTLHGTVLLLNNNDNTSYTWLGGYDIKDKDKCIENTGHANIVMSFADLCYQYIPNTFNLTDMQRFTNGFSKHIYQSPLNFADNIYGGNSSETCPGTTTSSQSLVTGGYTFLSKYDPAIYQIISDVWCQNAIYGGSGDLVGYSQLALYEHLFNPIAVARIGTGHWTNATSGDFNNDGSDYFAGINSAESGAIAVYGLDATNNINILTRYYPITLPFSDIAGGNFDPAHAGDEIAVLQVSNVNVAVISLLELNGSKLTGYALSPVGNEMALPEAIISLSSGDMDNDGIDEIVALGVSNLFIYKYSPVSGNFILINSFPVPNNNKVTVGHFEVGNTNEIAVMNATGYIQIFNSAGNSPYSYQAPSGTYSGISAGDFDGDGISEMILYNNALLDANNNIDAAFMIFKVKGGAIVHDTKDEEYFPTNQQNGVMCSAHFNNFPDRDALVALRNYDGQITIFNMDGLCQNLYVSNQNINSNTSINNPHTNPTIDNNYPIDYHVDNTLYASAFTVDAGSDVDFVAGKKIIVTAGSSGSVASSGSKFHAYIDNINLGCGNHEVFRASNTPKHNVPVIGSPAAFNDPSKPKTTNSLLADVSPNPNNGRFALQLKTQNESNLNEIFIYNSLGVLVQHHIMNYSTEQFDLSSEPKGIYFLKVQNADKAYSEKVVVQ